MRYIKVDIVSQRRITILEYDATKVEVQYPPWNLWSPSVPGQC